MIGFLHGTTIANIKDSYCYTWLMFERRKPGKHREGNGPDYEALLKEAQAPFQGIDGKTDLKYPEPLGPDRMVKFRPFSDAPGFNPNDSQQWTPRIARSEELYSEMREEYHIPMPETRYVVGPGTGPDSNEPGYYRVSDRIEGVDLTVAIEDRRSGLDFRELDGFVAELARYYTDKLAAGEDFVADIGLSQLMYGRLDTADQNRIYLADQEPLYSNQVSPSPAGATRLSLLEEAESLANMILFVRQRRRFDLPLAAEATMELFEALPDDARNHGMAQRAVERLKNDQPIQFE